MTESSRAQHTTSQSEPETPSRQRGWKEAKVEDIGFWLLALVLVGNATIALPERGQWLVAKTFALEVTGIAPAEPPAGWDRPPPWEGFGGGD